MLVLGFFDRCEAKRGLSSGIPGGYVDYISSGFELDGSGANEFNRINSVVCKTANGRASVAVSGIINVVVVLIKDLRACSQIMGIGKCDGIG